MSPPQPGLSTQVLRAASRPASAAKTSTDLDTTRKVSSLSPTTLIRKPNQPLARIKRRRFQNLCSKRRRRIRQIATTHQWIRTTRMKKQRKNGERKRKRSCPRYLLSHSPFNHLSSLYSLSNRYSQHRKCPTSLNCCPVSQQLKLKHPLSLQDSRSCSLSKPSPHNSHQCLRALTLALPRYLNSLPHSVSISNLLHKPPNLPKTRLV